MVWLQSLSSTQTTWASPRAEEAHGSMVKPGRQLLGFQSMHHERGSPKGRNSPWAQSRKKAAIEFDLVDPLPLQNSISSVGSHGSLASGVGRPSSQQSNLGMGRSRSKKLKAGARKLEPLHKQPISFDEMLSTAKLRVMEKRNGERRGTTLSPKPLNAKKITTLSGGLRLGELPQEEMFWSTNIFSKLQKDKSPKNQAFRTPEKRLSQRASRLSMWYSNPETVDPEERNQRFQSFSLTSNRESLQRAEAYISDVRTSILDDLPEKHMSRKSVLSAGRSSKSLLTVTSLDLAKAHLPDAGLHCSLRDALAAVQKENRNDLDGFTAQELERLRLAFARFGCEGEVHVDDLSDLLAHLGFLRSSNDVLNGMVRAVTPYSTLDFEELMIVTENYAVWERDFCREKFKAFDGDQSGKLDISELGSVLQSLGIYPLKATLVEAMEVVEADESGELDFDEFVHLMAVYRVTEGFTRSEVLSLWRVFDRFAKAAGSSREKPEMREDDLQDALILMFGPQATDNAKKIMEEILATERHKKSEVSVTLAGKPTSRGLQFPEFLVWARRLRELDIKSFRAQFDKYDTDGSGAIDITELKDAFRALGYTPLQPVIDEVLQRVDDDNNGELNFDEFINFISIFSESDGFMEAELEEFRHAFLHVAGDDQGEVSRVDLLGIIRSLGYISCLEDVRTIYDQVDVDGSGLLDFREFVHLMRLHRNDELQEVEDMFNRQKSGKTNTMPVAILGASLKTLGYGLTDRYLAEIVEKIVGLVNGNVASTTVDFDQFVQITDLSRKGVKNERKKKAGFTDEEIESLQAAFDKYDADDNGVIERNELSLLMDDLNLPLTTASDQQSLVPNLDRARTAAEECGVEKELIGAMGEAKMNFWPLVHFVRKLTQDQDEHFERREAEAIPEVKFAPKEVLDFRDLFTFFCQKSSTDTRISAGALSGAPQMAWQSKDRRREKDDANKPASRKVNKRVTCSKLLGNDSSEEGRNSNWLPWDGIVRVLRSFGVSLNSKDRTSLEEKLSKYDRDDHERIDFADFLRLMRWMVDTNFAGLGLTAKSDAV